MSSFSFVRVWFPQRTACSNFTNSSRWLCSISTTQVSNAQAGTARKRRSAANQARNAAHLDLKKEIDYLRANAENVYAINITLPQVVRKQCGLSTRLSRLRTIASHEDLSNTKLLRKKISGTLHRLFPEVEYKLLIKTSDDFDIRLGGRAVSDDRSLHEGIKQFEETGTPLYFEIVPHNLPPPVMPFSDRVRIVREKAKSVAQSSVAKLRMVSFYKFSRIENPEQTSAQLRKAWSTVGALGRVYVATEGVNAQLAVPEATWTDFIDVMNGNWRERGEFLIPTFLVGVYLNEDGLVQKTQQPFETLHVRPREKVLADGLENALDWSRAGSEMTADRWHEMMLKKPKDAILVDCRNQYESDVGRFEGAETPNTATFKETWGWLENRLKNVNKNAPIMTYCTGGIRCVKVNAFLEQEMGFSNTSRLSGGIVSYARYLEEHGMLGESKFRGVNHVFDGRVGKPITNDTFTTCLNCGEPCNIQTDCAHTACDRPFDKRLFIQCPDCAAKMQGTCSSMCLEALRRKEDSIQDAGESRALVDLGLVNLYSEEYTLPESSILQEVVRATNIMFPNRSHMLSGRVQGSILRLLIQMSNSRRVLELGTFTGYSTIAMAEGLPKDGRLVTCESEEAVAKVAEGFFAKDAKIESKIQLLLGPAMVSLKKMGELGAEPFDFVFVDANKAGYIEYYDYLLSAELVRIGGLMVFDNVLFRGLVPSLWKREKTANKDRAYLNDESALIRNRNRSLEKAQKLASKLHDFNDYVQQDNRTEQVLLPMRDGLLITRRIQ